MIEEIPTAKLLDYRNRTKEEFNRLFNISEKDETSKKTISK